MNEKTSIQELPVLISIIPNLMLGEGHIIPYHTAVSQAAHSLAWKHLVVIPSEKCQVDLPTNWYSCLISANLEDKIHPIKRIFNFHKICKLGFAIAAFVKSEILSDDSYSIIFLERFIHVQLLALLIALCIIPKKKLSVWLLYRRDIHKSKTRWIYKLLNQAIKKTLEPNKFHLLTDSEFLSKSLGTYFNEIITIMPIPHTDFIHIGHQAQISDEIICWWPGLPRIEKGWNIIKSLVKSGCEEANQISLVAAEKSGLLPTINGIKVKLINNYLTKVEYLNWLLTSNIILLPYDSLAYCERTSGIFTECIIAGKIPLVTPGTWMAKELIKYNLEELIIDWIQPEVVIKKIIDLSRSEIVINKIKLIQHDYKSFHCVESYAQNMKNLFSTSDKSFKQC